MHTTAGSYALVNSVVPGDATVVAKLRAAGAVIIGKANLSEFANLKGQVPSGWSARGGQTQSAYVKGGYAAGGAPGGSSSGSAVGVSAGFAAAAIGTETDGSMLVPCARAGVYGLKATVGLISRTGMVAPIRTADALGPITRSAYDAALLLDTMAGKDEKDLGSKWILLL
jgi:amidase